MVKQSHANAFADLLFQKWIFENIFRFTHFRFAISEMNPADPLWMFYSSYTILYIICTGALSEHICSSRFANMRPGMPYPFQICHFRCESVMAVLNAPFRMRDVRPRFAFPISEMNPPDQILHARSSISIQKYHPTFHVTHFPSTKHTSLSASVLRICVSHSCAGSFISLLLFRIRQTNPVFPGYL